MVIAKFKLSNGTHHAVRFDAAYGRHLQFHAIGGYDCASRAKDAKHACARIRRAADDLKRLSACVNRQDLQFVSLRVRGGADDPCNAEGGQGVSRVFNTFDFQTNAVQAVSDGWHIRVGVEMLFKPRKGEFH